MRWSINSQDLGFLDLVTAVCSGEGWMHGKRCNSAEVVSGLWVYESPRALEG